VVPLSPPAASTRAGEAVRVVPKHHALVRVSHWVNVPLLLGLIASGLAICWAAPVFTHARDPVTGSREVLQDAGIAISRALHQGGETWNWIYDHLSLGPRQLAVALRLHWALAYLFMVIAALYRLGLIAGAGRPARSPRPSELGAALAVPRFILAVSPLAIRRRPWPH